MMTGCDTLLTVGSNFPYSQFLPEFGQARAIQIDRSAKWIGLRYPYELNLVGDAGATLRAIIPLLERTADRSWRAWCTRTRTSEAAMTTLDVDRWSVETRLGATPV